MRLYQIPLSGMPEETGEAAAVPDDCRLRGSDLKFQEGFLRVVIGRNEASGWSRPPF